MDLIVALPSPRTENTSPSSHVKATFSFKVKFTFTNPCAMKVFAFSLEKL